MKQKRKYKRSKKTKKPSMLWIRIFELTLVCFLIMGAKAGWNKLKHSQFFEINQIKVLGTKHSTEEEILYLSGLKKGMGIFDFKLAEVAKKIQYHPWVKNVRIRRELPDCVVIEIEEQEPKAIIALDELYYLNSDLKIFKKLIPEDSLNYPIFTGINYSDLNNPSIKKWVEQAFAIWEIARNSKIIPCGQISEFYIEPEFGLSIILKKGPLVRLGEDNQKQRFKKLLKIAFEMGSDFHLLKELDLTHPERVVARFFKEEAEPKR